MLSVRTPCSPVVALFCDLRGAGRHHPRRSRPRFGTGRPTSRNPVATALQRDPRPGPHRRCDRSHGTGATRIRHGGRRPGHQEDHRARPRRIVHADTNLPDRSVHPVPGPVRRPRRPARLHSDARRAAPRRAATQRRLDVRSAFPPCRPRPSAPCFARNWAMRRSPPVRGRPLQRPAWSPSAERTAPTSPPRARGGKLFAEVEKYCS